MRSTFLVDYILTGMSVIEPNIQAAETKDGSHIPSNETVLLAEHAEEEQQQSPEVLKERTRSKKRKSKQANKARDSSHKKVKGEAYKNLAAIPLQA